MEKSLLPEDNISDNAVPIPIQVFLWRQIRYIRKDKI